MLDKQLIVVDNSGKKLKGVPILPPAVDSSGLNRVVIRIECAKDSPDFMRHKPLFPKSTTPTTTTTN